MLPTRVGEELRDRYHLRQCAYHTGRSLKQCQSLRCFEPGALSTMNGWKGVSIRLGVHQSRHLQVLAASFSQHFLPDHIAKLKHDHFYGGLPKRLKAKVAYLKARANEKTCSDYLCATWEAEKEELMKPSCSQTETMLAKPKEMSFFPLRKLKGSWPTKTPAVWVAHLEEEDADKEEYADSKDSDDIEGITDKFIVCLARVVKDAQQEEKHCYHCNNPKHFISSSHQNSKRSEFQHIRIPMSGILICWNSDMLEILIC